MTSTVLKWHNRIISLTYFAWLDKIPTCLRSRTVDENHAEPVVNVRQTLMLVRYLLLTLTSIFYLAASPPVPLYIKTSVVTSMIVATVLAQSLYDSDEMKTILANAFLQPREAPNNSLIGSIPGNLVILIIAETIGIALLILPTGGIDSPFVWYALNPVIAAAVYLPFLFCWGVLALFLGAAVAASVIYPGLPVPLLAFLYGRTSILLVFLFTVSLAQVAVTLIRKLIDAYTRLAAAHRATEASLEHISSLYQALEAFSAQEDEAQLAELLSGYTEKLCGLPGICWIKNGEEPELAVEAGGVLHVKGNLQYSVLAEQISRIWPVTDAGMGINVQTDRSLGGTILWTPIVYQGECFGLLACVEEKGPASRLEDTEKSLLFLAKLGGIILGRLQTDRLWGRLLINEEQNRIANEIHDGVAQYLFGITCSLHTLSHQESELQDPRVQEQLQLVMDVANRASRELRASIYKLSPRRRGENIFVDNLALYLDEIGRLNNIKVDLQAEGSEENLSPAVRQALYRIVREACSNAVRHGGCDDLKVQMYMYPGKTELWVKDNGCGYDPGKLCASHTEAGLGTTNMIQLAERLGGRFIVESEPGQGTSVCCTIPA